MFRPSFLISSVSMRGSFIVLPLLVGLGTLVHATPSHALQTVCTAAWTTGVSGGGTTGATPLSGGTLCPSPTVNTTLTVGTGANAGTFNPNYIWGTKAGSSNFPTTSNTSMDVGIQGTSSTEAITVTFSQLIANPFLYFGYTDNNTSFTFSQAFSLLQASNASKSGNQVLIAGASNSANDGFVVQMLGTYGPGNNLSFVYNNATGSDQSVTFTAGANAAPGPLPLLGAGMAFGFSRRLRQRLQG
jgi:hypothetical protein